MQKQKSYSRIIFEKIIIPVSAFGFVWWLIPKWPWILVVIILVFIVLVIIAAGGFLKDKY